MKKKFKSFCIFTAAVILFTVCFPVNVKAQENSIHNMEDREVKRPSDEDDGERRLWCSEQFQEMVNGLLEREDLKEILETTDEETRAAFLDGLSEAELYQMIILYRYSIVEEAARGGQISQDKDSLDKKKGKKREIDENLAFYLELIKRLHAIQKNKNIEGQQEHCEQADGEDGKIKEKEIEGENQTEQNAEENAAENEATSNVYGENSQPDHELAGSSPSDDKDSKSEASGNEKMGSGQEDTEGETPRDEYKGREETKWKQTEGSDSENEYAKMQQAEDGQKEDSWKENAFHIFKKVILNPKQEELKEISGVEIADILDFDDFIESRNRNSAYDLTELVRLLEELDHAEETKVQQVFDETLCFLYAIYGIDKNNAEDEADETAVVKSMRGNVIPVLGAAAGAGVTYRASCQTTGWQAWNSNGGSVGTAGSQKRMEALQIKITGDANLGITYESHVQSKGWMGWVSNGATTGTTGQSLRMEALRMKLIGQNAGSYDLYYRAYCESYGWLGWAKNGQSAGTVNISKRIEALQIVVTGKGAAAPGAVGGALKTNAVARVGSKYYTTFNSAFDGMPNGGTLYVIRNCEATHIVTTKSYSLYPEEQNVKVSFRETHMEPAGIICTPEGKTATWTLGGNEGFTLTMDACRKGGSGVLSTYGGTVNLKNGVRLINAWGNGVWNAYGTTNVYDGAWITGNGSNGIATMGNINIYGGKNYGNNYDGVRAEKTIRLSGGEIYNNRKSGVHVGEGDSTFIMTGGTIHDNESGVENIDGKANIQINAGNIYSNKLDGINIKGRQMTISGSVIIHNNGSAGVVVNGGTVSVTGGKIYSNSAGGIVNKSTLNVSGGEIYSNAATNGGGILNSGIFTKSGGSVTGNRASNAGGGICILPGGKLNLSGGTLKNNTAKTGKGIYHNGIAMNMSGNGMVSAENDVFLCAGKFISVTGRLNAQCAAMLTLNTYGNGRKTAENLCDNKMGSACYQKFGLTPNGGYCLRPGDYQISQSKAADKDVVLSTKYPIQFQKNYDGNVQSMPSNSEKYWYEAIRLATAVPSAPYLKFRGWSENVDVEKGEYQPGSELNASINRKVTLYAVWATKVKVNYIGNRNVPGEERSEYVTLKNCMANNGYTIRKNSEFTKYVGKDAVFAGWNTKPDESAKSVRFPDTQSCRLSFEQLLALAAEQQGKDYSSEALVQGVNLYASWDAFPVITSNRELEFYEGTEVTKEMLLQNMEAHDQEDGILTQDIEIRQIEYADGRIVDGEKKKGIIEQWKGDMPDDYHLDTWFMQMAEEDSPVVHKITYHVTDSFGNETSYIRNVSVKYNEFPVIQAEDRYFTLEEAKNGTITAKKLLTDAVKEERIKVSDREDDELYPGKLQEKIELLDFQEEDFQSFEESGYLVITYAVKDSMGPDGEGKETFSQCAIHVVEDGEVVEPEDPRYVRFINQTYYEKNQGGRDDQSGGLHSNSRWYQDPEYKAVIEASLLGEKDPEETWIFSREDVENVKKYIKEHGIGNSQQENAISDFLVRFSEMRIS